jgi:hypothetical protein
VLERDRNHVFKVFDEDDLSTIIGNLREKGYQLDDDPLKPFDETTKRFGKVELVAHLAAWVVDFHRMGRENFKELVYRPETEDAATTTTTTETSTPPVTQSEPKPEPKPETIPGKDQTMTTSTTPETPETDGKRKTFSGFDQLAEAWPEISGGKAAEDGSTEGGEADDDISDVLFEPATESQAATGNSEQGGNSGDGADEQDAATVAGGEGQGASVEDMTEELVNELFGPTDPYECLDREIGDIGSLKARQRRDQWRQTATKVAWILFGDRVVNDTAVGTSANARLHEALRMYGRARRGWILSEYKKRGVPAQLEQAFTDLAQRSREDRIRLILKLGEFVSALKDFDTNEVELLALAETPVVEADEDLDSAVSELFGDASAEPNSELDEDAGDLFANASAEPSTESNSELDDEVADLFGDASAEPNTESISELDDEVADLFGGDTETLTVAKVEIQPSPAAATTPAPQPAATATEAPAPTEQPKSLLDRFFSWLNS